MRTKALVRSAVIAGMLLGVSCGGNYTAEEFSARSAPTAEEHRQNVLGLQPPKRTRPVIAVLADNAGTETTDFLVPYGVLSESGLAEVIAVAPEAGPIKLMPALTVRAQQTTAAFDVSYPGGADYVIVPAMHHKDSPGVLDWIRAQADSGATIVAICSGALIVAETGLLDDHSVTTHWFDIDSLESENPTVTRIDNRRYVVDRGIVTTTGVTASVPVSLAIVEAIGGKPAAEALARRLGARDWSTTHESSAFRLNASSALVGLRSWISFWNHERIGIEVGDGVDEIALAFSADAYSRTYRSKAFAVAKEAGEVRTKRGLHLIPDMVGEQVDVHYSFRLEQEHHPVLALDAVLNDIEAHQGRSVAELVALQLEYPARQWERSQLPTRPIH
jgi:putative intracellular protease/amidase